MRENRVASALGAEAASLEALVKEVYNDTPLALHGLAQRSLWAHLLKLEEEGRAENIDAEWRIPH